MGAEQFEQYSEGKTAEEAFRDAVEAAQYEYGHGGYSGTIAEKGSFVKIEVPKDTNPRQFAEWAAQTIPNLNEWDPETRKMREYDHYPTDAPEEIRPALLKAAEAVDDKWGPAGMIELSDGQYIFFGWASS
jgi:hypothetical protein